jgi:hypothetical protein
VLAASQLALVFPRSNTNYLILTQSWLLPKLPQASKFEKKTLHANQKIKKERS